MGQYDNPRLATKDGILTGPEASQAKDPSECWGELETGQWSEMRASDCYLFHMQMRTFEIILQHKWGLHESDKSIACLHEAKNDW